MAFGFLPYPKPVQLTHSPLRIMSIALAISPGTIVIEAAELRPPMTTDLDQLPRDTSLSVRFHCVCGCRPLKTD